MTLLNLDTRIGKLALTAAAVAIGIIAFGAPAVMEASGGGAGASSGSGLGMFPAFIDWLSAWNLTAPSPI